MINDIPLMKKILDKTASSLDSNLLWFFFLATFCLFTSGPINAASEQLGPISMHLKNVSIREVIQKIEETSDYVFVFSGNIDAELAKSRNINVQNVSIETLLDQLLQGSALTYTILNKQIVIYERENVKKTKSSIGVKLGLQEPFPLTGQLIDKNQQPIVGAAIVLKEDKTKWAVSNFDGEFSFKNVPKNGTLVITSLGFEEKEISINGRNNIQITLNESVNALSEVIITSAYGTSQKRSNLVSSAYQVTSEQLQHLPGQRLDQMLEGIIPGLQYTPQSDNPSSARPRYSVTIRGQASMAASNEPLWIIDGTPLYTGNRTNMITGMQTSISPLSYINPQDIASITVLKDAAATSLYGADGANGVILITTKSGKEGAMRLNVSGKLGMSRINESTRFKVLNGQEYLSLARESYLNAGLDPIYFPFTDNPLNRYSQTSTNWYDVFYDTGSNAQINLSASGGSEHSTYYISGGYYQNQSTIIGNKQERFSLRTRNKVDISDKVSIDLSLAASYNVNSLFTPGRDYYNNLPIISPYNEDGTFRQYYRIIDGRLPNGDPNWVDRKFFNSLAEREQNDHGQRTLALQGNFKFNYEPLEGVTYTGQFGVDYQGSNENQYSSMKNWSGVNLEGVPEGYARWSNATFLSWSMIHRANFHKNFGLHRFSGVVGFEMSSRENRSVSAHGSGFVNDHIREVTYASSRTGSSSMRVTRKMSYLGQLTYSFDGRYNAVINLRKDGNSNFGSDVRWANFASLGARWNIHKESFFNSDIVDHLSIKGSYGSNGNSRIGSQEADGIYSIGEDYNYAGDPGAVMTTSPNPTLSWETTYMTNLGLRIALLDYRLDLTTEVYRNKTVNLLSNLNVSRTTGDTRVYRNIGAIENKGIEATITSMNILSDNFSWRTILIGSHNQNKILELYNDIPKNFNRTRWEEGADMNTYYLVRWAGVDPRDGAPLWYDVNGNITRTYSTLNEVADKSSSPDIYGSITNSFDYKNWSLRVQANYTIGGYAFSTFGRDVSSDGLNIMSQNQSVNQLDRWQLPGDLALSPKPLWGISTQSVMNSTRYLYEKTNIKLQNVSLTYMLGSVATERLGVEAMTLTLVGDNLGVWTPYDHANRNSYRNNMSGYPMEMSVSLQVNVSF